MDVVMNLESIYLFRPQEKIIESLKQGLEECENIDEKKLFLRRFKQGEELRIGLRYLIREADLPSTLSDLSDLADTYLQTCFYIACEELNHQSTFSGPLPNQFAIIGMGKLGGSELTFGSDLDVIFVYDERATEQSEFPSEELIAHYVALSQWIYKLTSEMTPAGRAYAIDTDLRPEGNQGLLVMSLEGYRDYFSSRARVWERQALTRSRFVAGNPQVGEQFVKIANDFVYEERLDYGSLIEISRLRERMEKELSGKSNKGVNVKLGYGGLADIEFTTQILLLMNGHRYPKLRLTNTLEAVKALGDNGIIDITEAEQLREYYLILRNLECALRIIDQSSSNNLPKDDFAIAALSRLLENVEGDTATLARQLREQYEDVTNKVRAVYKKTVGHLLRVAL